MTDKAYSIEPLMEVMDKLLALTAVLGTKSRITILCGAIF